MDCITRLCPLLLLNFPVLLCFLSVMFLYLSCPLTCVQHSVNFVSFLIADTSHYLYGLSMKRNGTKAGYLKRKNNSRGRGIQVFVF